MATEIEGSGAWWQVTLDGGGAAGQVLEVPGREIHQSDPVPGAPGYIFDVRGPDVYGVYVGEPPRQSAANNEVTSG